MLQHPLLSNLVQPRPLLVQEGAPQENWPTIKSREARMTGVLYTLFYLHLRCLAYQTESDDGGYDGRQK